MNSTSPKSSLAKIGLHPKAIKPFRILILGTSGVGKTGNYNSNSLNRFFFVSVYTLYRTNQNQIICFSLKQLNDENSNNIQF